MLTTTWLQRTQLQNQVAEPTMNIIRVKLKDDDLSEVDVKAELEAKANERMNIRLEAQLR